MRRESCCPGDVDSTGTANSITTEGCFPVKKRSQPGRKPKSKKPLWDLSHMPWYAAYTNLRTALETKLESVRNDLFSEVLNQLVQYVKHCDAQELLNTTRNEIVSATLLTGVNLPDHDALFTTLSAQLQKHVSPHIATLQARSCMTVKSAVEHMVGQFVSEGSDKINDSMERMPVLKKSQRNMLNLEIWYKSLTESLHKGTPRKRTKSSKDNKQNLLIVIVPDFESFTAQVLQTLILIVSDYVKTLPFVFIFGVATSVSALHHSLPYHVLSKLHNQVFQTQPSTMYLNKVLEEIFLSTDCPFHLEEKTFRLLTDVFLFYDFSVHGFIQGFNYCMMEHFFNENIKSLCCHISELPDAIKKLTKTELRSIRMLPSFCTYVDSLPSSEEKSLLQLDDVHTKVVITRLVKNLHKYLFTFHVVLRCLHTLTASLPKAPLGKHLREVYCKAVSSPVCESVPFKESFQLLGFLSQEHLIDKMEKVIAILQESNTKDAQLASLEEKLSEHCIRIRTVALTKSPKKFDMGTNLNRFQLKEKLLEFTRSEKMSPFEEARRDLLEFLTTELFTEFLVPANTLPLYELFFFSDVTKVKSHIVGLPRASLHMALNNPHFYLQCTCCELENSTSITPFLPDISILYKLHLECGRLINMYDWLQAFLSIVSPNKTGEEQRQVSPELQARFTHAVSELQFLGFIKSTRKKTDHVTRLTWGGS